MVIKASAGVEIRSLVDALAGGEETARESAAARLAVLGGRAVPRLLAAYPDARVSTRLAILRVLEGVGDPRALPLARAAVRDDPDVAVAGTQVLRVLLDARDPSVAAGALDALVTLALNPDLDRPLRLAALDAMQDMPADVRRPVADALGVEADAALGQTLSDPVPAGAGFPGTGDDNTGKDPSSLWAASLDGRLPDSPRMLAPAVAAEAATAPLASLQKMIDAVKAREGEDPENGNEWCALRGALHQALAVRGSRVALYDLRESLSAANGPLPVSFLAAVHAVGDTSCLEPLAKAHAQAAPQEEWWRQQVSTALRVVMTREKLTRRSAAIKRLAVRWPHAVDAACVGMAPVVAARRPKVRE